MLTLVQDSILSVHTDLLHKFQKKAQKFLGLLPCFFCNQDMMSWIVAILQESKASAIRQLLHTFSFSVFFLGSWLMALASHAFRLP